MRLRGRFGFMAYHGGALEAMTDVIAATAAERADASLYAVIQPDGMRDHLASIKVRPAESPALAAFLEHVDVVITVHGFGQRGLFGSLLLGGGNRPLADHVGRTLRRWLPAYDVITDLDAIPSPLRGLHAANPVNLPRRRRCADRTAAAGARCQPDVVGLGGSRPDPAHARAHRWPRRSRHIVAARRGLTAGSTPRFTGHRPSDSFTLLRINRSEPEHPDRNPTEIPTTADPGRISVGYRSESDRDRSESSPLAGAVGLCGRTRRAARAGFRSNVNERRFRWRARPRPPKAVYGARRSTCQRTGSSPASVPRRR